MLVQALTFGRGQLQDVARVGGDAPLVVVLAAGAGLVDVLAARTPVGGGGHLELAAFEILNGLHAAFAVAAIAHDDGAAMVLQTGGDNLGAAGAVAVDQHYHGKLGEAAVAFAVVDVFLADARPDADDSAVIDEHI